MLGYKVTVPFLTLINLIFIIITNTKQTEEL